MDIQFGEYRLCESERRLDRPQGSVRLGDRACEILRVLLDRPNCVVSKNDLLDAVWPNLAVEENTLQVHVSTLRKAIGSEIIKTVHGRGYQYVGPPPAASDTSATRQSTSVGSDSVGADSTAHSLLSVACSTHVLVMPFANLSDNKPPDLLAEGLWEDIVIELGRYRHLAVTPYRRTAEGTVRDTSATELGKTLAVDFVIEGTLRYIERAVRVNMRLIDAGTGTQVWGERFHFEIADVFSVQDAIVDAVISHLSFNLDDAARAKRLKDPTTSETAYTYFLKARSTWRAGDEVSAMRFAQKAVEVDPQYGRAHAYVAFFYSYSLFSQHLGLGSVETMALAENALDMALKADPNDPFTLQKLSMTLIMLGRPREGLRLSEAALRIGAQDGEIIVTYGHALIACGEYEKGQAFMDKAMSLMQRFVVPPGFYCGLGECRHICRDYVGSLSALEMMPDPPYDILLLKAANLARLGEVDAACRIVESPPQMFSRTRYARHMAKTCALPEDVEHFLTSFRLAGIDA